MDDRADGPARRVTRAFIETPVGGDRLIEALASVGVHVPENVRTVRIASTRGFVQFAEHDELVVSWEDRT